MDIQLWREILEPYELAVDELVVKFNHLITANRKAGNYSPIEQVHGRVKTISSILEKSQRKKIEMSEIENRIEDIAGIRVICQFVEDIDRVIEIIEKRNDMKVIQKKDYITNPKANGYRSLHLIVEIPIYLYNEKRYMRVEVQLRTIAMESWANLEHKLRYKKELSPAQLENTEHLLNECAQICAELDHKMQTIRDIIDENDD